MDFFTKKLYYENVWLSECKAKVVDFTADGIICDQTIAYPEGGGQIGDSGVLIIEQSNKVITFIDTQKIGGRTLKLEEFPSITVENPIVHVLEEPGLQIEKGTDVIIKINRERRYNLMATHTAVHLMLMGVEKITNLKATDIRGAKIDENKGRLDFKTEKKFTKEELDEITAYMKKLIDTNEAVKIFPHKEEIEAMYFECDNKIYPCGGTHLQSCKGIAEFKLKRKGLGRDMERIIIELTEPIFSESKFAV